MGNLNSDFLIVVIAGLLTLPGLYALYRGMHRDLEEQNMRLQVESYANEIQRLQIKVDEQQRKLNEMNLELLNLRATQRMLVENMKRLSTQVKQRGDEPVVDVEALMQMLQS